MFGFLKTLGKQNKKTKPMSKGGSETFKNCVFVGFPEGFFGVRLFSLVFLVVPKVFFVFFGIVGFPEAFARWSRCLGFRY